MIIGRCKKKRTRKRSKERGSKTKNVRSKRRPRGREQRYARTKEEAREGEGVGYNRDPPFRYSLLFVISGGGAKESRKAAERGSGDRATICRCTGQVAGGGGQGPRDKETKHHQRSGT